MDMRYTTIGFAVALYFAGTILVDAQTPCNLDPSVPPGSHTEDVLEFFLIGQEHWHDREAKFEVNPAGGPAGTRQAVGRAATTWNNSAWNGQGQSDFTFIDDGTTGVYHRWWDRQNVICFAYIGPDPDGSRPKARTYKNMDWFNDTHLTDVDTVINNHYAWSANPGSPTPDTFDVENVIAHEFGHWLSVRDLYNGADPNHAGCSEFEPFTMLQDVWAGKISQRTLDWGDRWGKWYIYTSGQVNVAPALFTKPGVATTCPIPGPASGLSVQLLPCFPSPANPEVWIPYRLLKESQVRIHVYDLRGALVRTLDLGPKPPGDYVTAERAAYWDGHNRSGERVASGLYFYTFETETEALADTLVISR